MVLPACFLHHINLWSLVKIVRIQEGKDELIAIPHPLPNDSNFRRKFFSVLDLTENCSMNHLDWPTISIVPAGATKPISAMCNHSPVSAPGGRL